MPVPLPVSSDLPVPSKVRWVEGDALDREAWHNDWDGDDDDLPEDENPSDPPEKADSDSDFDDDDSETDDGDFFDDLEDDAAAEDEVSEPPAARVEAPAEAAPRPDVRARGVLAVSDPAAIPDAGPAEAADLAGALDLPGSDGAPEDGDEPGGRKRSKTIARKQMLRERRRMLAQGTIPEILEYDRPVHRAECRDAKRPCLYVSCRYHLYLDVNPVTGSIKLNFPDKEVWEVAETCALDVAQRGGITLEEVGEIMNLTRERIRQVEVSGLEKLKNGEVKLHTFIDGRELQIDPIDTRRGLPIVTK